MLARRQSLDLLDGLDMDFLTVGYGAEGQMGGAESNGFSYEDDFFFGQHFEEKGLGQEEGVASDLFDPPSSSWGAHSRRTSSIGTSLGGGSFDLGGAFFEGLGGHLLPPSSRRHSLSMPPAVITPRSGFISGMGSGGDVDMSAYQSMAASLQAQGHGQVRWQQTGRRD